jgi:hypothetical protein
MKKAVFKGLEFYSFISTIAGLIGFIVMINEIQYRGRPDLSFLIEGDDFKEMLVGGNDRSFAVQIINVEDAYIMHDDPDLVNRLTQIIEAHPDYINAYYARGLMYLSHGYIEQGIADLQVVARRSVQPELRRQAAREIALAQLAQVVTPLAYVGTIGMAMLFISATFRMGGSSWARLRLVALIVVGILFVGSFLFLLIH